MIIDLSPLGLDKANQAVFCYRRLKEQEEYIINLEKRNLPKDRHRILLEDASVIKEAWINTLFPLLEKEC